jgi:uncharacterized protein (DUF362 family)
MKISRREMLQSMAAATAVATLAPRNLFAANDDMAAFTGEPAEATKKVVEALGGMSKFVSKGARVVIKPNMGWASPPVQGANTNPIVVRTLCELALNAGAKSVLVIDNPVQQLEPCMERNGYKEELHKLSDVVCKCVRDPKFFVETEIPKGRHLQKADVLRALLECDTLINAPVAKSHGSALVTFSMKNWMGAVHNRGLWHSSFDLHQCIADFSTFIKPKLIVLDASHVMTTKGPGGPGNSLALWRIYGGTDPVAIDSVAVTLAEWNGKKLGPNDVPHIKIAAEMGVGAIRQAELPVLPVVA